MALQAPTHELAQGENLLPKAPNNRVRHDSLAGDQFRHEYESLKIYEKPYLKPYTEFKTVYKT